MNIDDYVIVSDFDGTITREDSNDLLVHTCGCEENAQIELDFRAGLMGNREAMLRHFEAMPITLDEYHSFLDARINIAPGFDAFLRQARDRGMSVFIVSAGFRQAIRRVLGEERLRGVQVFANDLRGEDSLKPFFAHANPNCSEPRGPCGNCKKECVGAIRRQTGRKIIFIGDGLTDRCAVQKADLTFAKDDLARYCHSEGLPYTAFDSFDDIAEFVRVTAR